jgi:hypothetical protein
MRIHLHCLQWHGVEERCVSLRTCSLLPSRLSLSIPALRLAKSIQTDILLICSWPANRRAYLRWRQAWLGSVVRISRGFGGTDFPVRYRRGREAITHSARELPTKRVCGGGGGGGKRQRDGDGEANPAGRRVRTQMKRARNTQSALEKRTRRQ